AAASSGGVVPRHARRGAGGGPAAARDRRGGAELGGTDGSGGQRSAECGTRNAERKWKRRAETRDLYFQQGRPTPRPPSVSHPGPGALPARRAHLVNSTFRDRQGVL